LIAMQIARRTGYDPHLAIRKVGGFVKVLRSWLSVSALNAPRNPCFVGNADPSVAS